jgi:beta-1,4-mannooligosaccharide/beta-1,4-mannosyl-N-acetylglucosamine phosphorylase
MGSGETGDLHATDSDRKDLADPSRVIGYTKHFIFGPEELYERTGDVPNVVFPCGIILEANHTLKMYYGAADTCIAVAEARLEDILTLCV